MVPAEGESESHRETTAAKLVSLSRLRLAGECARCRVISSVDAAKCRHCSTPLDNSGEGVVDPVRLGIWGFLHPRTIHCLVCPPLTPIRLRRSRPCVIGRGEDCDVTLPGELVSRSHAAITFVEGEFVVEDLDSANGVYHNGVRIERPTGLTAGDELTIGGFQLSYRVRRGEDSSQDEIMKRIHGQAAVDPDDPADVEEIEADTVSGVIGDVFLLQFLSFLLVNRICGVLNVEGVDSGGTAHLHEGAIVEATCNRAGLETTGKDALRELVRLREGAFMFHERPWTGVAQIRESADDLLSSL